MVVVLVELVVELVPVGLVPVELDVELVPGHCMLLASLADTTNIIK